MASTIAPSWLTSPPLRLAARLVALALMLFLTCGPSVMAENDLNISSTFFLQDRKAAPIPAQRLRPQRPAAQVTGSRPAQRSSAPPVHRPSQAGTGVPDKAPGVPPRFFTAVLGDSLAVLMAQGLQEAYADRPEIGILRKGKESSGIVRDDFYDWSKAVTDLLAAPEHIDVAIMMIGSNDRQEIPDKASPVPFRAADGTAIAPDWLDAYANRVEALAGKFREKHVPLIWVGMPVMKNDKMSAELVQINEIFRNRASRAGAIYVDIWEAFLNDGGKFDPFGPDLNGEIVKLRTADGIHFTKPGARKLAHFVEGDIKRIFDATVSPEQPALASLPAPPAGEANLPPPQPDNTGIKATEQSDIDINAILLRQIGPAANEPVIASPAGNLGSLATLPLPAAPAPLFLPIRPLAGPVLSLTALALAPTGDLASRQDKKPPASQALALIDQTFADGRLARPRPGRADDFAWPRR